MRGHRASLAALSALALAGCGGSDELKPQASPQAERPSASPTDDAGVVKAWAKAVRSRDYDKAADLFAVPSTIANGGARTVARSRKLIDAFNRSLPCGAVVTGVAPAGSDRLLATFRLVEGPGGQCEGKAQVRFRIEDDHITEWIRTSGGPPPDAIET